MRPRRRPRIAWSIVLVWVVVIAAVIAGLTDLKRAVVVLAFITIAGFFGFRPGGTGGPTDSGFPGSGGPGNV